MGRKSIVYLGNVGWCNVVRVKFECVWGGELEYQYVRVGVKMIGGWEDLCVLIMRLWEFILMVRMSF